MKKKTNNININLIIISILISLYLILESVNIYFSPYLRISLTFISTIMASYILDYNELMLYFFCNVFFNILKNMKYGIFSLLFSFSSFISINIYFLYFKKQNKNITIIKCFLIKLIINIFINSFINTYFITLIYGKSAFLLLPIRLLKNIIILPFESIIIYYILNKLQYAFNKYDNLFH